MEELHQHVVRAPLERCTCGSAAVFFFSHRFSLWFRLKSTGDIPSEIKGIAATVLSIVDQENDQTTLLRRAHYGLETKNGLVDRLKEEVDLFMMTPEW